MRKVLAFSYNFFYFAGVASMFPFLVLYYQHLGLSGTQIGILTGIGPLISLFFSPFWAGVADATRRHRLIMMGALLGLVILPPLYTLTDSFTQVLLLVIEISIVSAPIGALADSATLALLGADRAQYGRIRLGGTLGYAAMAPLAGLLVQNFGLDMAFWTFSGMALLAFFASQGFVFSRAKDSPMNLENGMKVLFKEPRWILFLALALFSGMGIMSINNYLYPYLNGLQITGGWMGIATMLATVFEIPVFFFGDRLLKRFKSYTLLVIAIALLGTRLVLYYLVYFPAGTLALQLLNGLAFPLFWIAGVAYVDANSPAGLKATAQGLFSGTVFGFGSALGGLISGPMLVSLGGRGLFLFLGLIVLGSLVILITLERRLVVAAAV